MNLIYNTHTHSVEEVLNHRAICQDLVYSQINFQYYTNEDKICCQLYLDWCKCVIAHKLNFLNLGDMIAPQVHIPCATLLNFRDLWAIPYTVLTIRRI